MRCLVDENLSVPKRQTRRFSLFLVFQPVQFLNSPPSSFLCHRLDGAESRENTRDSAFKGTVQGHTMDLSVARAVRAQFALPFKQSLKKKSQKKLRPASHCPLSIHLMTP